MDEITKLSEQLALLKEQKEKAEESVKQLTAAIEATSDHMVALMRSMDLNSFKTGTGTFYIETRVRSRVVDMALAKDWLRSVQNESIIKETVNPQSLGLVVHQLAEAGHVLLTDLPSHGIDVYTTEKVKLTRKK